MTLEEYLSREWGRAGAPTFQVNAPCKLTASIDGRFTKQAFIGEEELIPFGAYVGKRGSLILKFAKPGIDKTREWIEMSVREAEANLDGFKSHYADVCNGFTDAHTASIREVAAAMEAEAAEQVRRSSNPLFGSW